MWLNSQGLNMLPILKLYGIDHNIAIYKKKDYSYYQMLFKSQNWGNVSKIGVL